MQNTNVTIKVHGNSIVKNLKWRHKCIENLNWKEPQPLPAKHIMNKEVPDLLSVHLHMQPQLWHQSDMQISLLLHGSKGQMWQENQPQSLKGDLHYMTTA